MNWWPRISLTLLLAAGSIAFADVAQELAGDWRYDGFFYQGHRYPNPNPNLKLTFTFNGDHSARLFWKRDDEAGFCERKGTWQLLDDVLTQDVTWTNPANEASCAQDPDMQVGRSTQNRISLHQGQLDLHMDLNGNDFLYILIQAPPPNEPPAILSRRP